MGTSGRSTLERVLAVLRHNRWQLAVDTALLAGWLFLGTASLRIVGVPRWLQYVVLFGGVVVYGHLTTSWDHPPVDAG